MIGADQRAAAADRHQDDDLNREGDAQERPARPCRGGDVQRARQAGQAAGQGEDERLVHGRVVAQGQHAVFVVADGRQDLAELAVHRAGTAEKANDQRAGDQEVQAGHADEVWPNSSSLAR